MAIALGTHTIAQNPAFTAGTTLTTTGITTSATGSTFLVYFTNSSTVSSVVDSFSNVYSLIDSANIVGVLSGIYGCDGASGGASHTATITLAASTGIALGLCEVTGAANPSTDVHANGSSNAGGTMPGAAVTTTNATDMVFSIFGSNNQSGAITDSGSGFSIVDSTVSNFGQGSLVSSSSIVSATGTYQDSYTGFAFGSYATVALKAAGGGTSALLGQTLS